MNARRASDSWNRISSLAREIKTGALKNLFHVFNEENLKEGFVALDGSKARGIDNVSKKDYEKKLDSNIKNLMTRLHGQSYAPKPKREVLIPKADGSKRPIAIACTEDKLVERVTANLLTGIYDQTFSRNSFGFRPGLSCHHAIRKVYNVLDVKNGYHFVVEIDLAKFFNTVNHRLLMKLLKKRIANKKLLSLVHRQLTAKIETEEGELVTPGMGTPQGGIVSPILANVFLHYAIDEWFEQNYKSKAEMVRYADDCIFMFKSKERAEEFLMTLRTRLDEYKLKLNEEKSRIINFTTNSNEGFDFLGFTFYRGRNRKVRGRLLAIKTSKKKLTKAFTDFTDWIKKNRNVMKTKELLKVVNLKLRGHYEYFGYRCNRNNLAKYHFEVSTALYKWLNRRSQKKDMSMERFIEAIAKHLYQPPEMMNLKSIGRDPYVY